MAETATEARSKSRPSPPPEPAFWLELARMLGETLGRARATIAPVRPLRPRRPTEALLRELGTLVSEHAQDDYASLEKEPRFWALVSHLHARHRETRAQGRARREKSGRGGPEQPVVPAVTAPNAQEPSAREPEAPSADEPEPAKAAEVELAEAEESRASAEEETPGEVSAAEEEEDR
jgi:hypothetical protein